MELFLHSGALQVGLLLLYGVHSLSNLVVDQAKMGAAGDFPLSELVI